MPKIDENMAHLAPVIRARVELFHKGEDDVTRYNFENSSVLWLEHNRQTKRTRIAFAYGRVYQIEDLQLGHCLALISSDHPGEVYNAVIKDMYQVSYVADIDNEGNVKEHE